MFAIFPCGKRRNYVTLVNQDMFVCLSLCLSFYSMNVHPPFIRPSTWQPLHVLVVYLPFCDVIIPRNPDTDDYCDEVSSSTEMQNSIIYIFGSNNKKNKPYPNFLIFVIVIKWNFTCTQYFCGYLRYPTMTSSGYCLTIIHGIYTYIRGQFDKSMSY